MRAFRFAFLALALQTGSLAVRAATSDIKPFVSETFRDRIEKLRQGTYCSALSCEIGIDAFTVTAQAGKPVYELATTSWLQGTVPKLKGSAKRVLKLTGNYTLKQCVIADVKVVSDTVEDNNGWGASGVAKIFKQLSIPAEIKLAKEDCDRVEKHLATLK